MNSASVNILLAEDNEANQVLFERILVKAGYNVSLAGNGQQALEALASTESGFDLCIMDMQMPVMGGSEAISKFRSAYPDSNLKFIVLSADDTKKTIDECETAGADMYIVKPVTSNDLLASIESALHGDDMQVIASDSSIVDINQLDYFKDPEFRDEFIRLFEESADKYLVTLEATLENNIELYKQTVHSIKGLSGNIGAKSLRTITTEAENIDQAMYEKMSKIYFTKIKDELNKVRQELVKISG